MFAAPGKADFDRNLSGILHDARREAQTERMRIQNDFIAKGVGQSTALIATVADSVDKIHRKSIERAMHLVRDFAERMQVPTAQVTPWARGTLQTLAETILAEIPPAGFAGFQQQTRSKYLVAFAQRREGALRDIETGFIGGRSMPIKDADRRAVLLRKFYDARHTTEWAPLPVEPSASREDQIIAANICRQLAQSGLIEWNGLGGDPAEGNGRITSRGIDVVEGNATAPIAITIDSRQYSISDSQNVQIGKGNAQGVTLNAEKIVAAINSWTATAQEKEEAKSLLQSVLDNPLLKKAFEIFTTGGSGGS
jgi:hypothetical protein